MTPTEGSVIHAPGQGEQRCRVNVQVAQRVQRRRARGESGASMVELAIILPIFLLLVFGTIQFGITYNNLITLRQGTREAARQGAVGNFGSVSSCSLNSPTGSSDIQKLMCMAKQQVGLNYANTRVKIMSGSADFTSSGTFQK